MCCAIIKIHDGKNWKIRNKELKTIFFFIFSFLSFFRSGFSSSLYLYIPVFLFLLHFLFPSFNSQSANGFGRLCFVLVHRVLKSLYYIHSFILCWCLFLVCVYVFAHHTHQCRHAPICEHLCTILLRDDTTYGGDGMCVCMCVSVWTQECFNFATSFFNGFSLAVLLPV